MREALGTLSESERRCVCYRASDESDFCDPAAPLQSRFQRAASQLRAGEESPLGASAAVLPDVQWQGEGMSLIDQGACLSSLRRGRLFTHSLSIYMH